MHASSNLGLSLYKPFDSTNFYQSNNHKSVYLMAPCLSITSPSPSSSVSLVSKTTICPDEKSQMKDIKLSVFDLPMLSCHYIQKGLFFSPPQNISMNHLISLLKTSLSRVLSFFPALAGRFITDLNHNIYIICNNAGVEFSYCMAPSLSLQTLLPKSSDVPQAIKSLFVMDGVVSYQGHCRPLASFQVTKLGDGAIFIGCSVNHAVTDGTSFWNFFNSWAEICKSTVPLPKPSRLPNYERCGLFSNSKAVLKFPDENGPELTFNPKAPLRERLFHFSREAILELKTRANFMSNKMDTNEISSFQSLCAQLWISVTRARKHLKEESNTTFRMAVNCRHRIRPCADLLYFGNGIQSAPTVATVREVASNDISWVAGLLHESVVKHGDKRVKEGVAEWEKAPRCFPLGNPDGAGLTMGSSPRFPMYEGNDFGWGLPIAMRSGRANKFDGKISALPGRNIGGSVELEVCLDPDTMAGLIEDEEFMFYVSE